MAIMIFLSELILVFFGVKQRIGGYETREERDERRGKREERREKRGGVITLRRAVMRCAVLCCG